MESGISQSAWSFYCPHMSSTSLSHTISPPNFPHHHTCHMSHRVALVSISRHHHHLLGHFHRSKDRKRSGQKRSIAMIKKRARVVFQICIFFSSKLHNHLIFMCRFEVSFKFGNHLRNIVL